MRPHTPFLFDCFEGPYVFFEHLGRRFDEKFFALRSRISAARKMDDPGRRRDREDWMERAAHALQDLEALVCEAKKYLREYEWMKDKYDPRAYNGWDNEVKVHEVVLERYMPIYADTMMMVYPNK